MQEEVQKLERQQELEKQEKANREDLKVPPTKRCSPLPDLYKTCSQTSTAQLLRAACTTCMVQ